MWQIINRTKFKAYLSPLRRGVRGRGLILLLLLSTFLYADNTVGGGDMPWDNDDPTTAIEHPIDSLSRQINTPALGAYTPNTPAPALVYDLQGRRVDNPQPGKIYICRGKKIIWTKQ